MVRELVKKTKEKEKSNLYIFFLLRRIGVYRPLIVILYAGR